ncbi:MAG: hypothetical protein AAF846_19425 [Chloroflexota bacterium]
MWMFAVYGGEWATDSDFPIPNDIELLHTTVNNEPNLRWSTKTRFYAYEVTPQSLKNWYEQNGMYMTPVALDNIGESFIKRDGVYETLTLTGYWASDWQEIHSWIATITTLFYLEYFPNCHFIKIYYDREVFEQDFPEMAWLPNTDNILVVRTCWANAY